jgi:proton glutamate symport protein
MVTMGIPAEGIGLLIAVDSIPDMFLTTLNVTGDMVAAAVVSRSQKSAPNLVEEQLSRAAVAADTNA